MYKIGSSSKHLELNDELFAQYALAGIQVMELAMSLERFLSLDYNKIKELADKHSVEIVSVHLPCGDCDPSRNESYDYTMGIYRTIIEKASAIGVHRYIVHTGVSSNDPDERTYALNVAKKNLSDIADMAAEYGSVIAVEVLPRTCLGRNSDEILELISLNDKLMVCFDTNHLLKEDSTEFIRKVGKRIVTTHVSDYDFVDEKHWLPGTGMINWDRLINTLIEVGYNGPWMHEVDFEYSDVLGRDITFEDLADKVNTILAPHFE